MSELSEQEIAGAFTEYAARQRSLAISAEKAGMTLETFQAAVDAAIESQGRAPSPFPKKHI